MTTEILQFSNKTSETVSSTIEGKVYRFRVRWSTGGETWSLDIADADSNPIILSRKLFPPHNITRIYKSDPRLPQAGDFWCIDSADVSHRPTLESLNDTFKIMYIPTADITSLGILDVF